jgi:transposase
MKVSSEYSMSFYSDRLTDRKHCLLSKQAELLRDVRNELSVLINSDLMKYLSMSKIDFQKSMLPLIKDIINSNFTKQVCDDVFNHYQNRFSAIQKHMMFEKVKSLEMTFYKRNTKNNKKGDRKGIIRKTESTDLTKVMSYLARYGNDNTISYLEKSIINEEFDSKRKFYAQALDYINRFGFDRLMRLALAKRTKVLSRYLEPIKFNSLSFRGRSRLTTDIVSYNHNFKSVIKAFVCFGWTETRSSIKIPVLYSKKWHGKMNKYTNGTDTSYIVSFVNDKIRIILTHEEDREFPDAVNCTNYVGFDANSKHNQLVGSNGITTDHNREVLNTLITELLHTDKLKEVNPDYKVGKRRFRKVETLRRKIIHHTQDNCVSICKKMNINGENHAIFENLDNGFGKSFAEKDGVNYNRLIKEMHLSSIKDEFEHIARKYNIAVSIVHAEYTSIQCPKCGYIDEGNRKNQEEFVCLECGHTENADNNASINIQMRISEAVPRDMLLKASKLGNGSYSPKSLKRYKVKEMLLSLRYLVYSSKPREAITIDPKSILTDF